MTHRRSWLLVSAFFVLACNAPEAISVPDGSVGAVCTTASDCDDHLFCNGVEQCVNDGSAHCEPAPVAPCRAGQHCLEASARCQTDCAVARDADGDGTDAIECGGSDCDDSDPHRFPGNAEVCDVNAHDEDCDPTTFGVRDADGDGEADAHCCNTPSTGPPNCGTDCDDSSSNVHPGQAETCNTRDDDCDGAVDEMASLAFYPDLDHDGYGDAHGASVMACTPTAGTVQNMLDCDDTQSGANPAAPEVCDGIDNDCDTMIDEGLAVTLYPDADRDGYGDAHATGMRECPTEGFVADHTDCNDTTPSARPGLTEACDGLDNDCNGNIDDGLSQTLYPDMDGDGDGAASAAGVLRCPGPGYVALHTDCDDTNRVTYGSAPELCDTMDNDCDTRVDEGTVSVPWYVDADSDGFGDTHQPAMLSCSPIAGRSQLADCDDHRADVYPGAPQRCDGVDDTCVMNDGSGHAAPLASEDADGDMHSAPAAACMGGFPRDDCDDTMMSAHPGATELCDRIDENCSNGGGVAADEDVDGDGHTAIAFTCSGGTLPHDDCDDARMATHPGATETCDGIDDDCSSGGGTLAAEDGDGDHFSPMSASCTGGYPKTDCDDTRATVFPGAAETCDLLDDNCSGAVDEGCPASIAVSTTATETRHLHDPQCSPVNAGSTVCPANAALVGVDLYTQPTLSDVRLNALNAVCASVGLGTSGATGAPQVYTAQIGSSSASSGAFGMQTGPRAQLRCPAGTVTTRVRYGAHQIECQPLVVMGSVGAFSVVAMGATTTVGSTAHVIAEDLDPPACSTGYVVTSFSGNACVSATPAMARLDATCSQLTVPLR